MRRIMVLFGAGASIHYGVPATKKLSKIIEDEIINDDLCKYTGADTTFLNIKDTLASYLSLEPNFEQIFHCAHELGFLVPPTAGAVDEFKPILQPFVTPNIKIDKAALTELTKKITACIFDSFCALCNSNREPLDKMKRFIDIIQKDTVLRMYTTNYDDFPLQARPDLYVGFNRAVAQQFVTFDPRDFWDHKNANCLYHLHGSVHLAFPHPGPTEIGELAWFADRNEAARFSYFGGAAGSDRRMDGSSIYRSAVVTGLQKLGNLQVAPLSHFYAGMAEDAIRADIILIIGSGLTDLHLNTWLEEARRRSNGAPILFVDYYADGFESTYFERPSSKEIAMFHRLHMHFSEQFRGSRLHDWLISDDRSAAIWDKGFSSLLDANEDDLKAVIDHILT